MGLEKTGLHAVITGMGAFRSASNEIDRTFTQLGNRSERAAGRMSKLGQIAKTAIGFAVGQVALGAIKSFTGGIVDMLASAAPLVDMENAFKRLATSYDINAEQMIEAMGRASKGTIADADLIQSANKALIGSGKELGKEFGEALPQLLEMARASAKATGQDVGFLFESLVTGIKRSSPMIIDNTGLQLKLGEAQAAYAKELGKTTQIRVDNTKAIGEGTQKLADLRASLRLARIRQSEFTDKTKESTRVSAQMRIDKLTRQIAEQTGKVGKLSAAHGTLATATEGTTVELTAEQKQIALLRATLEAGADMVERMGDEQLTTAELMAQARAQMKNLRNEIGKAFVPIMGKLLKRYLIPFAKLLVRTIVPWTKRFADGLDVVADIVEAFLTLTPGDFPWEDFFPEWIADRLYTISDWIERARDTISRFRTSLQVGGLAMFPWGQIFPTWLARYLYQLADAIDDVRGRFPSLSAVVDRARSIWERFQAEGIRGILPSMAEIRGAIETSLTPRIAETRQRLGEWVEGVIAWIKEQPTRIAEAIAEWGQEITRWLDARAPGAELTAEQMGMLTAPAEDVVREMRPWWSSIADAIIIGWDGVVATVEAKAREYQRRFSEALMGWLQVQPVWEDASALGPRYESPILRMIAEWVGEVAGWLGEVGIPTLIDALLGFAGAIIEAIFHFDAPEQTILDNQLTPLETALVDGFKEIGTSAGRAFVDGLRTGMAERWQLFWGRVTDPMRWIESLATLKIPTGEVKGVAAQAEAMYEEIYGAPAKAAVAPFATGFGADIGANMLGGVEDEWTARMDPIFKDLFKKVPTDVQKKAEDYGEDLAEALIEGTRDALKMHSTSRVYVEIGEDVAESLAEGIESPTSIYRVTDALMTLIGESRYRALPIIQHLGDQTGRGFIDRVAAEVRNSVYVLSNAMINTWVQATNMALSGYSPPRLPGPIIGAPTYEEPTFPDPIWPEPGAPYSFQFGGVVPGPKGQARWIVAHGGEIILPAWSGPVPAITPMQRVITRQTTNVWSPNLTANYEQVQDEGSIAQDLETLAILYRMGP